MKEVDLITTLANSVEMDMKDLQKKHRHAIHSREVRLLKPFVSLQTLCFDFSKSCTMPVVLTLLWLWPFGTLLTEVLSLAPYAVFLTLIQHVCI